MSLLLLLKAAAASGGSGDGSQQLNADGAYILDADGNLYLKCCCGCLNCTLTPTAYDMEFASVHVCPGYTHGIAAHTFHAPGPTGPAPFAVCVWSESITVGADTAGASIGVDAGGASVLLVDGATLGTPAFFYSGEVAYGPDCSATLLVANIFTLASCSTGPNVGYGGNASAAPVLPP